MVAFIFWLVSTKDLIPVVVISRTIRRRDSLRASVCVLVVCCVKHPLSSHDFSTRLFWTACVLVQLFWFPQLFLHQLRCRLSSPANVFPLLFFLWPNKNSFLIEWKRTSSPASKNKLGQKKRNRAESSDGFSSVSSTSTTLSSRSTPAALWPLFTIFSCIVYRWMTVVLFDRLAKESASLRPSVESQRRHDRKKKRSEQKNSKQSCDEKKPRKNHGKKKKAKTRGRRNFYKTGKRQKKMA